MCKKKQFLLSSTTEHVSSQDSTKLHFYHLTIIITILYMSMEFVFSFFLSFVTWYATITEIRTHSSIKC